MNQKEPGGTEPRLQGHVLWKGAVNGVYFERDFLADVGPQYMTDEQRATLTAQIEARRRTFDFEVHSSPQTPTERVLDVDADRVAKEKLSDLLALYGVDDLEKKPEK